ncbi:MAG: RNA polymerase sigma factor [Bacteroidaceae bacterium]|nr:RNA polymerase sigma factor [Bacteroidaceae bacterium]
METFAIRLLELQDKLQKFALYLTTDKEKANDLFQETVLKTLENQEKYIREENLLAWIKKIMFNTFISDKRRILDNQKYSTRTSRDMQIDIPDETGTNDFHLKISLNELTSAIEKLQSPIERQTISLFLAGYKYEEIAQITDSKIGTVKSRLNKIKEKLSKQLTD